MAMLVIALMLAVIQLCASANSEHPPPLNLPVIYNARILEDGQEGCSDAVLVRAELEGKLRSVVRSAILPRIPVGLQQSIPASSCSEIAHNPRRASVCIGLEVPMGVQCRSTVTWTECVAAIPLEGGHVLPTST